jgi:hypothetical protein
MKILDVFILSKKCCLNCELYLKVKGHTNIGDVYYCHPRLMKKIKHEELGYYSCDRWRLKYNLSQEVDELFGGLFKK